MENTRGMVSRNRCLKIKNLGFEGVKCSKIQFLMTKFNFFTWQIWKQLKSQKIMTFLNIRWRSELSKLVIIPKWFHNSLKNIWTDPTGFNTNPKGGNRLWRTREAWFREIDVLKKGLWHDSAIIILKDIWTDRTGFNTNPKGGEIDYGEHDRHGFAKSMFWKYRSSVLRVPNIQTLNVW